MNRSPSQPTLRDLLRPVAAHRLLLAAVVLLAVAASVAYSVIRKPVYTASASVAYQDSTYDLGLVGLNAPATRTPDELAAAGAETIIQPSVAASVARMLHSPEPPSALLGRVSATVQPNSNLVVIQASAPTAAGASQLANAFAALGAKATNDQLRRLYASAYRAALGQAGASKALISQDLSRLKVLSTIATAAQVVAPAQPPASPSSPRPLRDAALAAFLGVVLGLLAVYVRDSFDRRLRSMADVEQQFALPLLGHVRTEALGLSPKPTGGGAGPAPADWELFRILRRNLDFLEPSNQVRSVAVTSSLPEEGKSTVAAFLAFTSAAAGKRTLLIEADLRRPSLAKRLGMMPTPGLSDFVLGDAQPSDILQEIPFGGSSPNGNGNGNGHGHRKNGAEATPPSAGEGRFAHNLVFIAAGTPTSHPVEILRSEALAQMLVEVQATYDLVIIDTPPVLSVVDALELLPQVEASIVCVRVFHTTQQQAIAGKAALERLPHRPSGLVVTGTRPGKGPEYGYYGYYN